MMFGEVAFVDRSPRSANVTAVDDVECVVLVRDDLACLTAKAPAVAIRLLENMALGLTQLLRLANRELAALR
jgi:CRP-like cAMP-binding protein